MRKTRSPTRPARTSPARARRGPPPARAKGPPRSTGRIRDSIHEELLQSLARSDDLPAVEALLGRAAALPEEEPGRDALVRCARTAIQVQQQIQQHQQRERGLLAVSETAAALTRMLTGGEVLQGIVTHGRQLLGCHVAWVASLDRATGRTSVLAADGEATEAVRAMRGDPSVGVAGRVIGSGAPFFSRDYASDARFPHDPDIDAALASEGIRGLAGVPLVSEGQVVGVLLVADRYPRVYQPWEISILSTLASHASIAIRNATIFETARTALATMEEANRRVEEQSAAVRAAADAHEKFTLIVARGGGIAELAPLVADALGGSVVITDQAGAVLCSNSRPPAPAVPVQPQGGGGAAVDVRVRAAIGESRAEGRSVAVPLAGGGACRVAASVGGAGFLGAIVLCTPEPLTAASVRILERAAMVVAVLLLSHERRSASAHEEATQVVRDLLGPHAGRRTEHVERAARLGLDLAQPFVVAALELDEVRPSQALDRMAAAMKGVPRLAAELEGRLVLLVAGEDAAGLRDRISGAVFTRSGLHGLGAVSRPCRGARSGELSAVHQRLVHCLGLLRGLGRRDAIALESEVGFYAELLRGQGPEDLELFLRGTIGPVLDRDARRKSRLAETLLAYLDNAYGAKAASEALGIHVNTLMNRLGTLAELLGDWQAQRRGAELHLALKVWRLRGQRPAPE